MPPGYMKPAEAMLSSFDLILLCLYTAFLRIPDSVLILELILFYLLEFLLH